jgi:hypothetical protein
VECTPELKSGGRSSSGHKYSAERTVRRFSAAAGTRCVQGFGRVYGHARASSGREWILMVMSVQLSPVWAAALAWAAW